MAGTALLLRCCFYSQLGWRLPSDRLMAKNMENILQKSNFPGAPHVRVTFVYGPAFLQNSGQDSGLVLHPSCFTWISTDVYFYPRFMLTHHNSDKNMLVCRFTNTPILFILLLLFLLLFCKMRCAYFTLF